MNDNIENLVLALTKERKRKICSNTVQKIIDEKKFHVLEDATISLVKNRLPEIYDNLVLSAIEFGDSRYVQYLDSISKSKIKTGLEIVLKNNDTYEKLSASSLERLRVTNKSEYTSILAKLSRNGITNVKDAKQFLSDIYNYSPSHFQYFLNNAIDAHPKNSKNYFEMVSEIDVKIGPRLFEHVLQLLEDGGESRKVAFDVASKLDNSSLLSFMKNVIQKKGHESDISKLLPTMGSRYPKLFAKLYKEYGKLQDHPAQKDYKKLADPIFFEGTVKSLHFLKEIDQDYFVSEFELALKYKGFEESNLCKSSRILTKKTIDAFVQTDSKRYHALMEEIIEFKTMKKNELNLFYGLGEYYACDKDGFEKLMSFTVNTLNKMYNNPKEYFKEFGKEFHKTNPWSTILSYLDMSLRDINFAKNEEILFNLIFGLEKGWMQNSLIGLYDKLSKEQERNILVAGQTCKATLKDFLPIAKKHPDLYLDHFNKAFKSGINNANLSDLEILPEISLKQYFSFVKKIGSGTYIRLNEDIIDKMVVAYNDQVADFLVSNPECIKALTNNIGLLYWVNNPLTKSLIDKGFDFKTISDEFDHGNHPNKISLNYPSMMSPDAPLNNLTVETLNDLVKKNKVDTETLLKSSCKNQGISIKLLEGDIYQPAFDLSLRTLLSNFDNVEGFQNLNLAKLANKYFFKYPTSVRQTTPEKEFIDEAIDLLRIFVHNDKKANMLINLLNSTNHVPLLEAIECAKINMNNSSTLTKNVNSGFWGDVYQAFDSGISSIIKISKSPNESDFKDNPRISKIIRHFSGITDGTIKKNLNLEDISNGLKNMLETELTNSAKLARKGRVSKFSNVKEHDYFPVPYISPNLIEVEINGEKRYGLRYEEVTGISLQEFIMNKPDIKSLVQVMAKTAYSLSYTHQNGLCHNDVHTENFIVDVIDENNVYALDFAFSKSNFYSGSLVGKMTHVAPEHIKGKEYGEEKAGEKADQFAFGSIMYLSLMGEEPRSYDLAETRDEYINRVDSGDLQPDFEKLKESVNSELYSIVKKCLDFNPDERFDTMRDVENALVDYWRKWK